MKIFGIDISTWQREFDYDDLDKNNIKFVILRAGFDITKDDMFEKHYEEISKRNIDIGCYWYTYARTKEEASMEAKKFLETVKNKKITYPLYLDIEDKTLSNLSKETLDSIIDTFGRIIEQNGYYFGVYSNLNWYKNKISGSKLNKKYDWWIAYWESDAPSNINYGIWQNTSKYDYRGINIDSDYCFKDYPKIIADAKLNHLDDSNDIKPSIYIVKKGDTLSKIASIYNLNYKYLAKYNNINNPNLIYPGQAIKIPNETNSKIYIVKRGDDLTKIANMFNTTVNDLVTLNDIKKPDLIYPGQKIIIDN